MSFNHSILYVFGATACIEWENQLLEMYAKLSDADQIATLNVAEYMVARPSGRELAVAEVAELLESAKRT